MSTPPNATSDPNGNQKMMDVLTHLLKEQAEQNGATLTNESMAHTLITNMQKLVKEGKLSQAQIIQLKEFADKHKAPGSSPGPSTSKTPTIPQQNMTNFPGFKGGPDVNAMTSMQSSPSSDAYPISTTLAPTPVAPVQWAHQMRPTLTGGVPSGRVTGTPTHVARPEDAGLLSFDDEPAARAGSRRKNAPGEQSMRRTIQDLVSSIDPNVKIEAEVEDLLLNIADEFIDSVTNFACRLAKHRGGETLEVRDLQLHLERNHNIRIPGFASDETRIALSQSSVAPAIPAAAAAGKKSAQGSHMTLRSQRINQVQQAKREAKLV